MDAQVAEHIVHHCLSDWGAGASPFDITCSASFCFLGTRSPNGLSLWEMLPERGLMFEVLAQESCQCLGILCR